MPQVIRCPHCSKGIQVPDNAGGKQLRCPLCSRMFIVGGQPAPAKEPVGAAAGGQGTAGPAAPPSRPPPAPRGGPPATPTECPACKSPLLPGAISCMDCGFLLQSDTAAQETEGAPNLCINPACGVANPPGETTCQRCSTPLP